MKTTARRALALLALALVGAAVASCNTVEGVGRDIKAAGSGLEGAAQDAKD